MADEAETPTPDTENFNKDKFLASIVAEQTKKRKESLKQKVTALLGERETAAKTVRIKDKEIDEEIAKFVAGV